MELPKRQNMIDQRVNNAQRPCRGNSLELELNHCVKLLEQKFILFNNLTKVLIGNFTNPTAAFHRCDFLIC